MAVHKKIFNTYADALDGIAALIKGRKVDLSVRHVLLVPEKDTLKCEKLLFCGGGAFDVEVYSLSRWFFKLGGEVLSKTGAVMMLKDILFDLDLKCFFRSKSFDGFCKRLYDTLCAFEASGADLSRIQASGALDLKLDDLRAVYAEFKKRTSNKYVDKAGKIALIANRLKSDNFLKNTHVYAANFGRLTAVEKSLMDTIAQKALSFTFAQVEGEPQIKGNIQVYKSAGTVQALKAAANRILKYAKSGTEFKDMCVVLPASAAEQCRRIFSESDIPFYIDKTVSLAASGIGRYVSLLLSLKKLNRKDFILLSKNPFSGIAQDDSDVFESYCNQFLIDYLSFSRPFELFDKDEIEGKQTMQTAERVREALYKKVSAFNKRLDGAKSTHDFVELVSRAIEKTEDTPFKQRILSVLDTLNTYMAGQLNTKKRLQFLVSAFKEGLSAESLSMLPRTQGCVTVGDTGIFKGERFKHTFVIGFNEGVIPEIKAEDGLITPAECQALKSLGVDISDNEQENNLREYEFLQLLSSSDNIFLSYNMDGQSRPSPLLYRLSFKNKKITYTGLEQDRLTLEFGDDDSLLNLVQSKSAALELLILTHNKPVRLTSSLYKMFGRSADKFLSPPPPPQAIQSGLFFKQKTVSASQLRCYFTCPYKHFIEYGLKIKESKSGRVSVLDIGSAVHKVNQLYADSGFKDDKLQGFINEVLSEGVYKLKQNQRLKDRLKKEITDSCLKFGALIKNSKFSGQSAEVRFGLNTKLKGCDLGGVTLKGAIDLFDVFNGYARVIDYKTGWAEFSEKQLYYGKGIQLPLYMQVLNQNGLTPAAMLYFVFKSGFNESCKFSGIYLKDIDIVKAFDPDMTDESSVLTAKIKTTKSGESITGKGAADTDKLNGYLDYAVEVCKKAVSQIQDGVILPSPLKDGKSACDYCLFLPACGFHGAPRELKKALIGGTKEDICDED